MKQGFFKAMERVADMFEGTDGKFSIRRILGAVLILTVVFCTIRICNGFAAILIRAGREGFPPEAAVVLQAAVGGLTQAGILLGVVLSGGLMFFGITTFQSLKERAMEAKAELTKPE